MTLLDRFLAGDRLALARMISHVEDRLPRYHEALARIFARGRGAYRVGLTGPPGAGKSSLVNRLAHKLATDGLSVGVIAVDPTSPFTGGAVLGDRVRMQALYGLPNVFVRSMATRGSPGGLAAATKDVSVLLEGFGFDIILVETVGVGQVELDVAAVCDTVVVVFVPESGDSIQAMKSGLMEIADVFCINKADRPGAERVEAELQSVLDVRRDVHRPRSGAEDAPVWEPLVVPTVAIHDTGIDALWEAARRHQEFHNASDPNGHRRQRARSDLMLSLSELVRTRLENEVFDSGVLDRAVEEILDGKADPYTLAQELFGRWRTGG
ncbi:MAG TPA: methylmalonyl Co-A mutase-associated GTPase MeaB [Acidobacteriota bacterium]|nr:methylmalonyl Co-A mutase-associated GTPase MeaB [Acidobacteriota bacterium]